MQFVVAYNPGRTPARVSSLGHVIGGGEWGVVDRYDEVGAGALAHLVEIDVGDEEPRAEVRQALDECERLNERAARVEQLTDKKLAEILPDGDDARARQALVRGRDTLPAAPKPRSKKASKDADDQES